MKKKVVILLSCLLYLSVGLAIAQDKRVSGTVFDETGDPVIGASVLAKGTTIGTATSIEGAFSISVPTQVNTLIISYLGYKTIEVAAGTNLRVTLSPEERVLNEVVVSALGITREKRALGFSATTVTSEDINATGNRSAMNALQGKVPGVEINSASGSPGASTQVVLRGISTLGGSGSIQPLYVVDGVPVSNGVMNDDDLNGGYDFGNRANDINPNDIESMTILKGAAATALYGSRAAGGVIMITTKTGSKSGGKAKVEITSTTSFENPLKLPTFQNEFGQGWYDGDLASNLMENGSWGPRFAGNGQVRPWGFVVDNQQQIKPYVAMKNNVRDFFDTGVTTNNNISISNGDGEKNFYISYGNIMSDGIMPSKSDSYNRNNIAVKGSTKFLKILSASGALNYVRKDSRFVITGQDQSVLDAIWQTPRDINIVDLKDYKNKFNNVENYYTVYSQNPYYVLNEHGTRYGEDRIYGNASLDAQILPWLKATFRAGGDFANSTLKMWRAITINSWGYNDEKGLVYEGGWRTSEINTDFMLDIHKNFDFGLTVDAVLGHNFNQRDARAQYAMVKVLDIPMYYNLSNSSSVPSIYEAISKRRLVGAYASVDLGYKNMLYLNMTARNDWSSTLPLKNKSFFYPGASLSFIFTELLPKNNILTFGKLRAGIAQTGKDADPYMVYPYFIQPNIDNGAISDGYMTQTFPLTGGINGFTLSNLIGNDKLKPELSTEKELGFDLRFLKNRIGLDMAVYNKSTTNLIWQAPIAASTGYTAQTMNLGKITNDGVELSANFVPVETRDFKWEVNVNYTKNNNKLVSLTEGLDQISISGTSSLTLVSRPGYSIGLFYATVPDKDPNGNPIVNAQGLPLFKSEKQIVGSMQNKYRIGGGTTLTYKGLSLRATVDYRNGGLMYSRDAEILYFTGNTPYTTYNDRQPFIIPNSVQKVGDTYVENTTPIAGFANNMNLYYNQQFNAGIGGAYALISKTFFKLRELSISYSLPKSILRKTFIGGVDIALVGTNLFIWTPDSNLFGDPEATTFGNELGAGYGNYGATPSTRSLGFNLKLSF